ncbi:hypothetical protein KDW36_29290 [Burkholderia dolosa]|uniref:hypothetical protein n=1 Tax=Burkholderia dolosa TaxID=152500 RepID=UPI001B8DE4F6|nr:hypothetical protein [Burkholderia dolosa]MBR8317263.1 hypothetical protein [Burkholderia dolosa]
MYVPLGTAGAGQGLGSADGASLFDTLAGVATSALGAVGGAAAPTDAGLLQKSLLGDAEPFDYAEDLSADDVFSLAAKTPNTGDANTWFTNPGSGQMRYYGPDGMPMIDLDFDHSHAGMKPHAHNWDGPVRGEAVPFSPLP